MWKGCGPPRGITENSLTHDTNHVQNYTNHVEIESYLITVVIKSTVNLKTLPNRLYLQYQDCKVPKIDIQMPGKLLNPENDNRRRASKKIYFVNLNFRIDVAHR